MNKLFTSPFAIGIVLLASVGTAGAQQLIPITDDPVLGDNDGFIKPFLGDVLGLRSTGGDAAKSVRQALASGSLTLTGPVDPGVQSKSQALLKPAGTPDVQVNDPALDHVISFPGFTRPFEESTQSETSVAV